MSFTRFQILACLGSTLALVHVSSATEPDSSSQIEAKPERKPNGGKGQISFQWSPIWSDQLRSGSSELKSHALPDSQRWTPVSTSTHALKISANWKLPLLATVNFQLPILWREHFATGPGDMEESKAEMTGIGDFRFGSRFAEIPGVPVGFEIGLKLPTGSTTEEFTSGPRRGQMAARESQLGTGSTDVVVGANTSLLGQYLTASVQYPILHEAGYTPGTQVVGTWSYFLTWFQSVTPQLRAKAIWEDNGTGAKADAANSGSFQVALQPSLNIRLQGGSGIWTELGLPALYRRVNGIQTAPGYTFSLGIFSQL